ncbi:hypothetical protein [Brasilonema sennae]|uniref:hypothetical protein n=1 Tax=Brasilonema sennae TaxID=1397703 RepID=UPI00155AE3E3|nr:hypothetical protein [Brasilonema sennae]
MLQRGEPHARRLKSRNPFGSRSWGKPRQIPRSGNPHQELAPQDPSGTPVT